jgi:hypothetical protein
VCSGFTDWNARWPPAVSWLGVYIDVGPLCSQSFCADQSMKWLKTTGVSPVPLWADKRIFRTSNIFFLPAYSRHITIGWVPIPFSGVPVLTLFWTGSACGTCRAFRPKVASANHNVLILVTTAEMSVINSHVTFSPLIICHSMWVIFRIRLKSFTEFARQFRVSYPYRTVKHGFSLMCALTVGLYTWTRALVGRGCFDYRVLVLLLT